MRGWWVWRLGDGGGQGSSSSALGSASATTPSWLARTRAWPAHTTRFSSHGTCNSNAAAFSQSGSEHSGTITTRAWVLTNVPIAGRSTVRPRGPGRSQSSRQGYPRSSGEISHGRPSSPSEPGTHSTPACPEKFAGRDPVLEAECSATIELQAGPPSSSRPNRPMGGRVRPLPVRSNLRRSLATSQRLTTLGRRAGVVRRYTFPLSR